MEISPLFLSDFYKVSHRDQYPAGTEVIYSNLTPRSSRMEGVNHVVFFGLQYFVKEYLIGQFKYNFFGLHDTLFDRMLASYKRRLTNALGGSHDVSHWRELRNLGYLPLEIKALPEGSLVPLRVPVLTIRNTHNSFAWLTQWVETLLSNVLWYPITTSTISYQYRKIVDQYNEETSDLPDHKKYACHDFSMRGNTSVESSSIGGAGHLLSFAGTDTIPTIDYLEHYYGADSSKELVGCSIASTEHSVQCMEGEEGEFNVYKRLLTEVYPSGPIGIVSDTYDLWRVLTDYLPRLKDVIMSRNGSLQIRPDSGNPVDILCGKECNQLVNTGTCDSPACKGVIQLLWETFGGTINSKGYKQLDSHIGAVYGDSITLDRCKEIYQRLKEKGFACSNVILGIGSFSFQYNTRDTLGLAMKATWAKINGIGTPIYKDPITDSGMKKSAKGLLMVKPRSVDNGNNTGYVDFSSYELVENVTEEMEQSSWNQLRPVFRDGQLLKETSLREIRDRLSRSM